MSKAKHTDNDYTIAEAYRYLANAKETLGKSQIEYGRYTDRKYVSEASGIAYLAALRALDVYLLTNGIAEKKLPKSIEGYWVFMKHHIPLNGKLTASLRIVYEDLHIGAYYRGFTSVNVIKDGLLHVKKIIEMINKLMVNTAAQNIVNEPKPPYKRPKSKVLK